MRNLMSDEKRAYETIKNTKDKFGVFHKICFHVHTPESYDYKLFKTTNSEYQEELSAEAIFNICIEKNIIPSILRLDEILLNGDNSCYSNKKECFAFLLLAEALISNNIEIVVVADHHTINGIDKLRCAINTISKMKSIHVYPEIILGIEISCADKNHVVGIFEDNDSNRKNIKEWLDENLFNIREGSFKTSAEVLQYVSSINGIGYLAHLDTSDIFKEDYLSGAYKKNLFNDNTLQFIGVAKYDNIEYINSKIKPFRSSPIQFILDNDSHDIDSINDNLFWIKGSKRNYSMIKEALNDYDISISFKDEYQERQCIKGIYIKNKEEGFLNGNDKDAFCLTFSNSLNCLIGGRGTGKSSVLEILEYILSQCCENEKRLDFICSHGSSWILYDYRGQEYLIEMRMPIKNDSQESILRWFGQNKSDKYNFRYYYDEDAVRDYALSKFLKISKVVHDNDKYYFETIPNKQQMLRTFFDVRYSINKLVNTASGEEINKFIYKILFENKIICRPENVIKFKSKSGLMKNLDEIKNALKKRKEDVISVIKPFNANQQNILKIVYSQQKIVAEPEFESWLFNNNYKKNEWYENYNITNENIIEYLIVLYNKLGIFDFLEMVVCQNVDTAEKTEKLLNFISVMTPNMVDKGISSLSFKEINHIIKGIFVSLITDNNINKIICYLKKYVADVEEFSLEFNINNKEGNANSAMYRAVGELSLGQKVVAMLSFILGYSEYSNDYRPLIIDQPEDNLDNQYIYKNLVKQLRAIKEKRQIIIATHNATIVTNAKADQVCVMKSDNKHGWIETTGYPGELRIKKHIINYLEGGRESFLHKMKIYEDGLK